MAFLKRSGAMIAMAALLLAHPAATTAAQTEVIAPPAPDADALAAEMRVLAANPNDVTALISAGELALKLGDPTAAARFFARADKIDPRNARLKAGTARTLLALERPGEALRLFADAEMLGYDPRNYAADRGLAFDLVGEQARAQRDYRLALKQGADNETARRYALSLGISGRKDQALAQIDALLRESDRGAWRVRAFVLAMAGDTSGAERIATSMLPGGMASGLMPFFERLPALNAVDRAFAVHFGEVAPTAARLADARLTPHFAPLPPEPQPPVRLATNDALSARDRRAAEARARKQRGRQPVVAAVTLPPLPPVPREAANEDRPALVATSSAPASSIAMVQPLASKTALPASVSPPIVKQAPAAPPATVQTPILAPTPTPAPTPVRVELADKNAGPPPISILPTVQESGASPSSASAVADNPALLSPAVEPAPAPRPVASEQSILARIVASIGVPASELGVPPVKSPSTTPVEAVAVRDAPKAAALPVDAPKSEKPAIDRKAAAREAAEKKAADKAAADKKAAKAEPSRIWVQVAGGSSVGDLPREWARLRAKAGVAFQGKQAWTTPLRFTNRLLAGPFKSGDEAQGFVNQLTKAGITGFVFTSDQGQKIARVATK